MQFLRVLCRVSMPWVGLLLFLRLQLLRLLIQYHGSVNALGRATPISTYKNILIRRCRLWCQCPRSGYSYFYIIRRQEIWQRNLLSVNALGRATPISTTLMLILGVCFGVMCQCPRSGYSYFYDWIDNQGGFKSYVSMP